MSQLTYNLNPAIGVAGMVAESREGQIVLSKVAENTLGVGLLCAPGTRGEVGPSPTTASPYSASPGQVKAFPTGISDDPLLDSEWVGVPIYDSSRPPYSSSDEYLVDEYVPVLFRGAIWVNSETAVTQWTDVYVRTAASGPLTTLGKFSAGTGTGKVKFPRGRWVTTSSAAGLALLVIS